MMRYKQIKQTLCVIKSKIKLSYSYRLLKSQQNPQKTKMCPCQFVLGHFLGSTNNNSFWRLDAVWQIGFLFIICLKLTFYNEPGEIILVIN